MVILRKLLMATALFAVASIPLSASAETITTGVSNSVGSSVFCGQAQSSATSVYNANGTFMTSSFADKLVTSGYDAANSGHQSNVSTTESRGESQNSSRDVRGGVNVGELAGGSFHDNNSNSDSHSISTTSDTKEGNGAAVGLNGITEHSGSQSLTAGVFAQHDTSRSSQSGYLTQFSANSSVSSFTSTGL